jgi:hypothetical protein
VARNDDDDDDNNNNNNNNNLKHKRTCRKNISTHIQIRLKNLQQIPSYYVDKNQESRESKGGTIGSLNEISEITISY